MVLDFGEQKINELSRYGLAVHWAQRCLPRLKVLMFFNDAEVLTYSCFCVGTAQGPHSLAHPMDEQGLLPSQAC